MLTLTYIYVACYFCNQIQFNFKSSNNMSCPASQPPTTFTVRDFSKDISLQPKDNFQNILATTKGANFFTRYLPAEEYIKNAAQNELWFQNRALLSTPTNFVRASDENQNEFYGSNFASNNYLGLSKHPSTIEAGIEAAKVFGVNSAGSPLAFGATKYYMQLKEEISEFWNSGTLIYSAGWLAGFGVIKGLVKDYDHVVIDEFADNSFFEGARAATRNVHKFRHLDQAHMAELVKSIRAKDTENAILVVTESLFPLDSASPDLVAYQKIANDLKSYLLIGCGHDFGILGATGKGVWEEQGLTDRSNVLLVGTGSKSLSINFGFVGITDRLIPEYLKYYSTAYMFTNAINPVQANSALATLRVVRSQEGKQLRAKVLKNSSFLRDLLSSKGFNVLGRIAPFVCVRVGNEIVARIITRILMDNQIHINLVEYPAAPIGQAVVRFSLMPEHTEDQLVKLVAALEVSSKKATEVFQRESAKQSKACPKL